jgi:hypothetical protein
MDLNNAQKAFLTLKNYYDNIDQPKYRNIDFESFKKRYDELTGLKDQLESDVLYNRLVNAMSQVIARVKIQRELSAAKKGSLWSNLSERGMNKAIPAIYKKKEGLKFPIEWTDKWGHTGYVSNGFWTAKNYRVMDALGYMFLLKEGGDRLPEECCPIFYDLFDIESRENHLHVTANSNDSQKGNSKNKVSSNQDSGANRYSIGFTDKDFRKCTGLTFNSSAIHNLLLETSRVEFKVSFPVRLKSTGNKENLHRMNFYSRFFELAYEDTHIRKDGIVQQRRYRIYFNTLLGELFVNNLKARFNDKIDLKFYTLPDSAQVFYRRMLLHHSFPALEINLSKLANAAGLQDSNVANLMKTVETNILEPLKEHAYIESYKMVAGMSEPKYIVLRTPGGNDQMSKDAGSVKEGCRVGKERMLGR